MDAVAAAPNVYRILFENDRVRVLEFLAKPGDRTPRHSHPTHFGIALESGTVRFTLSDGSSQDARLEPGTVVWLDAQSHEVENVGSSSMRAIVVELKDGESGAPIRQRVRKKSVRK